MKKVGIVAGIVVIGGIIAFALLNPAATAGEEVYLAEVEQGDIVSVVSATGSIQARTKVNISSNVFGEITDLPVEEGDIVRKGRVLARIDQERYLQEVRSLGARLRMAKIAIEQEQTRLKLYESQLKRAEALRGQGILPEESYEQTQLARDTSRIQLKSLEEAVSQAEAALDKAKDELEKTVIYAPMDGKITQLNTEVGEQVIVGTTNVPGSTMMVLSDMSEVLAEVDVDETEVVKVRMGQAAEVEVDAVEDRIYPGRVTEIRNSARRSQDASVFGVKILLDDPDERLRPGMSASAGIEIERRKGVIQIPIQAVLERTAKEIAKEVSGSERRRERRKGGTSDDAEKVEPADEEPAESRDAGEADDARKADSADEKTARAERPGADAIPAGLAGNGDPAGAEGVSKPKADEDRTVDIVYVFRDGKARLVEVEIGIADETNVQVLSGLEPGDEVITGPYRALRKLEHGDAVKEKEEETADEDEEESDS